MTAPLVSPLLVGTAPRKMDSAAALPVESDHLAALDGLRGIAIVLVLVFHLTWTFPDTTATTLAIKRVLWGGWVGVDVFFVLSGYLITRGLVKPSALPIRTRLKNFWARRVLRIFPLYYAALAVGSLAAVLLGAPVPGLAYWLYAQNYALAFDHDVLAWTSHLWSLAVEEQFYFVWPAVVFALPHRARMPFVVGAFAMGALGRAALVLGASPWDTETTAKVVYRATATHMDGLLAGALVAMMAADPAHAFSRAWARVRHVARPALVSALFALVVLTRGFGTYDRRVLVVGYPLLALAVAAVLEGVAAGGVAGPVQRVLASPALRACGRYSYGMYVFHWPLVAVAVPALTRVQDGLAPLSSAVVSLVFVVTAFAFTFAAAVASYHNFELRFLRRKERFKDDVTTLEISMPGAPRVR